MIILFVDNETPGGERTVVVLLLQGHWTDGHRTDGAA